MSEELLQGLQKWLAHFVAKNPGKTQRELSKLLGGQVIGKRLKECEELGMVRRGDKRICEVSNFLADTWWTNE